MSKITRTFKTTTHTGVHKTVQQMQERIDTALTEMGLYADWNDIRNFRGGQDFFKYPVYHSEEGYQVGEVIERPSSFTILVEVYNVL